MLRVTVLGSGSRGNAVAVTRGTRDRGILLLDCGFSRKEIYKRLEIAGLQGDVELCLVTHRHSDHSLSAKHFNSVFFDDSTETLNWRGCAITPFRLAHDVPCVGFRIDSGGISIAYLTDFSEVPEESMKHILGLDLIMIESNYREELLIEAALEGECVWGNPIERHLSNSKAACLLQTACSDRLKHVVLVHLSKMNNSKEFAWLTAKEAVPQAEIIVAGQDYPTKTITIIK